jgi:hypothetical protein
MNKLILILVLALFGCATQSPTRTVFNCQREYILGDSTLFIGGSTINDQIECGYVQVPIAPKSKPLEVHPELIDKNQK